VGLQHTHRQSYRRRPDIVVVDKCNAKTTTIDIAVPGDYRVSDKESEKIGKC